MLNHIALMGRLTREPELRYTQSQLPVASFTVAVDRDYSGRDGGEKQTDFINCTAWRSTAEFIQKYFRKGSMIVVSGRLQIRQYTDKDNNKRTAAEVVADSVYFGESKNSYGAQPTGGSQPNYQPQGYPQTPQGYQQPTGYAPPPAYGYPPQNYQQSAPPPAQNCQPPAQQQTFTPPPQAYQQQTFTDMGDADDGELPF